MSVKQLALVFAVLVSCGGFARGDSFGSGTNAFDIDFVAIGNPGNVTDTTGKPNPAGSVSYNYRIGKFEISESLVNKANAAGGLAITLSSRGAEKPATAVTWNEAARFVNWLNTSSGSAPAYKFAVQPGQGGYSANASIVLWSPGDAGYDPNNRYRNSLARYFLPSVDEWYKAAFYDPNNQVYYNYPTGSNTIPAPVGSGTAAGTAVYGQTFAAGPADVSLAGGLSPYGTMGQGGNVFEFEETDFDLVNDSATAARGARGGEWEYTDFAMLATQRSDFPPHLIGNSTGFRVASISLSSPPGDFNANGVVDAADYVLWRKKGGSATDYSLWRSRFGQSSQASGTLNDGGQVPEPATGLTLVVGSLGCVFLRRSRNNW